VRSTVVREKISEAQARWVVVEEADIEEAHWGGAKVVIRAFRGRTLVEEPEEADLDAVRLRCVVGVWGSGSVNFGSISWGLGMRRDVRPPPGRYVFKGAVSWRQG